MRHCERCKREVSPTDRFCSQCGTPLPEDHSLAGDVSATMAFGLPSKVEGEELPSLSDVDAQAVEALPKGHALLIVAHGPKAGSRYLLDTDVTTVGRHPDSDIFLDDITVSRRHVEFRRDDLGFTVHDLGSLNGTYRNTDRIDDSSLQNGDEVRVGKFRLLYFDSSAKAV